MTVAAATLMTTSGQKTWPSGSSPARMLNAPMPTPATSASSIPDREPPVPGTRETRTTATSASTIPARTARCRQPVPGDADDDRQHRGDQRRSPGRRRPSGRPPALVQPDDPDRHRRRRPRRRSRSWPARESARERRSRVPRTRRRRRPGRRARRRGPARDGSPSRRRSRRRPRRSRRRDRRRRPPSRARTAQPWATPSAFGVHAGEVVDLGRAGERDHRVGRRVVAIRGRQVDDLEVARDVAQELERAGRSGVVEGHERVVEDQRRPPVAGHEPDEPDAGDEIDEIERPLAQRRDVDPVAPLRRVEPDVEGLVVDLDAPVAALRHSLDVGDHLASRGSGSPTSSSPARPARSR